MNPHYLWLTERLESFNVLLVRTSTCDCHCVQVLAEEGPNSKLHGTRCVAFITSFILLFVLAKWIDADVRTPQYFLQLTCVLLSFLSFGLAQGYLFFRLARPRIPHNATRLK